VDRGCLFLYFTAHATRGRSAHTPAQCTNASTTHHWVHCRPTLSVCVHVCDLQVFVLAAEELSKMTDMDELLVGRYGTQRHTPTQTPPPNSSAASHYMPSTHPSHSPHICVPSNPLATDSPLGVDPPIPYCSCKHTAPQSYCASCHLYCCTIYLVSAPPPYLTPHPSCLCCPPPPRQAVPRLPEHPCHQQGAVGPRCRPHGGGGPGHHTPWLH